MSCHLAGPVPGPVAFLQNGVFPEISLPGKNTLITPLQLIAIVQRTPE